MGSKGAFWQIDDLWPFFLPERFKDGRDHVDAIEEGQGHQKEIERIAEFASRQQDAEQDVTLRKEDEKDVSKLIEGALR